MDKRNLCKSSDSLMTPSAAVVVEINLPKSGTSTAMPLGMT